MLYQHVIAGKNIYIKSGRTLLSTTTIGYVFHVCVGNRGVTQLVSNCGRIRSLMLMRG